MCELKCSHPIALITFIIYCKPLMVRRQDFCFVSADISVFVTIKSYGCEKKYIIKTLCLCILLLFSFFKLTGASLIYLHSRGPNTLKTYLVDFLYIFFLSNLPRRLLKFYKDATGSTGIYMVNSVCIMIIQSDR